MERGSARGSRERHQGRTQTQAEPKKPSGEILDIVNLKQMKMGDLQLKLSTSKLIVLEVVSKHQISFKG